MIINYTQNKEFFLHFYRKEWSISTDFHYFFELNLLLETKRDYAQYLTYFLLFFMHPPDIYHFMCIKSMFEPSQSSMFHGYRLKDILEDYQSFAFFDKNIIQYQHHFGQKCLRALISSYSNGASQKHNKLVCISCKVILDLRNVKTQYKFFCLSEIYLICTKPWPFLCFVEVNNATLWFLSELIFL